MLSDRDCEVTRFALATYLSKRSKTDSIRKLITILEFCVSKRQFKLTSNLMFNQILKLLYSCALIYFLYNFIV